MIETQKIQLALSYVISKLSDSENQEEIEPLKSLQQLCQETLDLRSLKWVTNSNGLKVLTYLISLNTFDNFGYVYSLTEDNKTKYLIYFSNYSLSVKFKDKCFAQESDAMLFMEEVAVSEGNVIVAF